VVSFFLAIGVLLLFECLDIIHSSEVPMALPLLYEIANSIVFHQRACKLCYIGKADRIFETLKITMDILMMRREKLDNHPTTIRA